MKRIITIYLVLLLGLFSLWAVPNTLYFMEYLPYNQYMNPALQPRCTTYVEIPAISTVSVYGNTGGLSLNDFMYVKDDKLVTFLHPEFGNKEAVYSKIMKSPGVDMETDISLLGFGFRIKEKGYFTFNTSLRLDATAGLPSDLVTLGLYGTPDTINVNSYNLATRMSANAYADFNVGYSHQINDKWTVGGRLHILLGLANINAELYDSSIDITQQQWRAKANVISNVSMPFVKFMVDEDGRIDSYDFIESFKDLFVDYKPSMGASIDLGAVYKPLPELKVSFSVKDFGFMVWNTSAQEITGSFDYSFEGVDLKELNEEEKEETSSSETTEDNLLSEIDLYSKDTRYTTMMNGKIYAGVEYSFLENMMSIGLISKTSYNYNHWDEEITIGYNIRPCSWFGLSASYSLVSGKSSTIGLGLNLRLPPLSFYVVSDYTPVHYSADGIPYKVSALNVQAGLVLTMGCKKKKVEESFE